MARTALQQLSGTQRAWLGTAGIGLPATLAGVAQLALLSAIIGDVFLGREDLNGISVPLAFLPLAMLARAGLLWLQEVVAQRGASRAKAVLRRRLVAHLFALGPHYLASERAGELVATATEGVERLEPYVARYEPQVVLSVLVPLVIAAVVWTQDPVSAVILLVTAPVIPLLMVLVGSYAGGHITLQWDALSRMSAFLLETIQGLPTLVLFGRAAAQRESVARVSLAFRERTIRVLRYAFLSGLVLEFMTSGAIALIAVELGTRLIAGSVSFQRALLVLLLAPEFYRPLRELGVHRHAAMEGNAAAARIAAILAAPTQGGPEGAAGAGHGGGLKPAASAVSAGMVCDAGASDSSESRHFGAWGRHRRGGAVGGRDDIRVPSRRASGPDTEVSWQEPHTEVSALARTSSAGAAPVGAMRDCRTHRWVPMADTRPPAHLTQRVPGTRYPVPGRLRSGQDGDAANKAAWKCTSKGHDALPRPEGRGFSYRSGVVQPSMPMSIAFTHLRYAYPGVAEPALDGVSLSLPAGTRTAVVGPSGAGKSTLVGLLLRFLEPAPGQIAANGIDITEQAPEDWRRLVALVPQRPHLFHGTIRDNILLGRPDASEAALIWAAEQAGVTDYVARLPLGYDTPVGERGAMLSGGEAQRIAIARAFLKDAPLLVLDEPTSSLDPVSEALIRDALDRLAQDRTTVVVAHRLNTVYTADQIAVLESGRLVELGDHRALLARGGLYSRLVGERGLVPA